MGATAPPARLPGCGIKGIILHLMIMPAEAGGGPQRDVAFESWCFRIRFRMGLTVQLGVDEPEWVLTPPNETPVLTLRAAQEGHPINGAEHLVLIAKGHPDQVAAWSAALDWRSVLMKAFGRLAIGADFGDRAPKSAFTEAGLRQLEEEYDFPRVLNDEHGIMVFSEGRPPRFASITFPTGVAITPRNRVALAIGAARGAARLSDQEVLAYDLFGASFFQPSADARFLMLMTALETMIEQAPRPDDVNAWVDELISQTRRADLNSAQKESLAGSLEGLKRESVGQAGRRVIAALTGRTYQGKSAKAFFTACYEVRSALVHGHFPRPSPEQVGGLAADLEHFVGHLISGQLAQALSD